MAPVLPSVGFVEMIPRASVMVAGLTRFAGSLRSLRDPLEEAVDEVLRPGVETAFARQGPGWEALKPATIRIRESEGFSAGPILTKTGNLRSVATSKGIWEFHGQTYASAFVADLPGAEYGEYHQTGTDHMPERPFMNISEGQMNQIKNIFERFISVNASKYVASGYALSRLVR